MNRTKYKRVINIRLLLKVFIYVYDDMMKNLPDLFKIRAGFTLLNSQIKILIISESK